jgi:hypothetical protein
MDPCVKYNWKIHLSFLQESGGLYYYVRGVMLYFHQGILSCPWLHECLDWVGFVDCYQPYKTRLPDYSFVPWTDLLYQEECISNSSNPISLMSLEKANQVADVLAKMGLSQPYHLRVYDSPPDCISLALLADWSGTFRSSVVGFLTPFIHQKKLLKCVPTCHTILIYKATNK